MDTGASIALDQASISILSLARCPATSVEDAGMDLGFLTLQERRVLHAQAMATSAEASRSRTSLARSECRLFDACNAFNKLELQKIWLLKTGDEDDPRLDLALARLGMEQANCLTGMSGERAVTIQGHRARATAFALWDAGDLDYRAREGEATEDMLLSAIVRDLTIGRDRP